MKANDERRLVDAFSNYQDSKARGLYIHIPFCKSKCHYCDFLSFSSRDNEVDNYVEHLIDEISIYGNIYGTVDIDSIYFGGGTPSHIPAKSIARILEKVYSSFNWNGGEVTIEVNPEIISEDALRIYSNSGINRISLGAQSLDDELLNLIGRGHRAIDILYAVDKSRNCGIENISLDLIFAIPSQSLGDFERDLHKIIDINPKHISIYSLIVEDGTRIKYLMEKNKLNPVDEELDRKMYHNAINILENNSYHQYEISNFATEKMESKHNLKYWRNDEYIGIGLGSSSYFKGERYRNIFKLKDYYKSIEDDKLPILDREIISLNALKIDYILMNMRLKRGIERAEYKRIFEIDFYEEYRDLIDKYHKNKLIDIKKENIRFTTKGFDISNSFFVEII
ncbi:MAG: radical SAM family heme chaperone HemW [Tissierellia bacterium]|nr:radical SAM family heme chaperone HemW [Tissierellia bacterium]